LTFIEQALHPARSAIGRPIPDVSFGGKRSQQGWDNGILNQLPVVLEVGVMMVVVMAVMYYHYHLRLRRIGYCETEDEHESEQNSFHSLVCRSANPITELL
jgi:hypothetical protein